MVLIRSTRFPRGFKLNIENSFRSLSSGSDAPFFDVIIAGGGLVGTAMACAIAKNTKLADRKILLIDQTPEKSWSLSKNYSNRVVTINDGSKKLFESLGTWEMIEKLRLKPVKKLQVWESHSESMFTFDKGNYKQDLAFVIENDVILNTLLAVALKQENITILRPTAVSQYETTAKQVLVKTDDGKSFKGKLLCLMKLVAKINVLNLSGWKTFLPTFK